MKDNDSTNLFLIENINTNKIKLIMSVTIS